MNKKYNKAYFESRDILIPHLADTIKNILIKNHLQKVLDVGCGTGLLVKYLNSHNFEALGCDSSVEGVKTAKMANNRKKIILSKATNLPFKNNLFDLITSISVIEHLTQKDALKFILESKRILKKNGFIFLVTPNFASPIRHLMGSNWFAYKDATHINFFTPKKLSALLVNLGFINPTIRFKVAYNPQYDRQFPISFSILPRTLKILLLHTLFNSPIAIVRDSLWILAQKNEKKD